MRSNFSSGVGRGVWNGGGDVVVDFAGSYIRLVPVSTAWACFSEKIQRNNSPIDFDPWLLDSNDHAIALAAKRIANKATGDAAATDHSRCIELIFATEPICNVC